MRLSVLKISMLFLLAFMANAYGSSNMISKENKYVSTFTTLKADSTKKFAAGTEALEFGNYVVVGVFAVHSNAVKFTQHVAEKGFDANYGVRDDREYYYVYLFHSDNWEDAANETYRIREDWELQDAWVMRYANPDEAYQEEETEVLNEVAPATNFVETAPTIAIVEETSETMEEEASLSIADLQGDFFILPRPFRLKDNQPVEAQIELVDNKRAKLIKNLPANEVSGVFDPRNGNASIKLICGVFGYRKVEHNFQLTNPVNDSTKTFIQVNEEKNIIEVDFPLERLKQGDIAVMYNVYFFNDAAIMRPESKYEVNSLLEMLMENPKMKIKIHGHTNGGKPGRIIRLSEGQTDYFNMSREVDEGVGSAKDLSEERGEIIKKYLIEQGVSKERMHVKGWGGKKMIYDKDSPQAKKNIRVEIEIVND